MARSGVPEFPLPRVTTVRELMDLLLACRDGDPVGLLDHALQTAALLRRSHPFDKELQIASLVHGLDRLLRPGEGGRRSGPAGEAVGALLGDRVARLLRLHARAPAVGGRGGGPACGPDGDSRGGRGPGPRQGSDDGPDTEAALALGRAHAAAAAGALDAGVLEDWRPVLELVAAGAYRSPERPPH